MKYCTNCGNPMEDDMKFCQKCGTKFTYVAAEPEPVQEAEIVEDTNDVFEDASNKTERTGLRKGMLTGAIICAVLGVIFALTGKSSDGTNTAIGFGLLFFIPACMFLVLSKSPRNNKYLFNMQSGLKKPGFVVLSLILAFALAGFFVSKDVPASDVNAQTTTEEVKQEQNATTENNTSMKDVQKWYENNISAATQSLIKYSDSVNGLTNMNITQSKFLFGDEDGWYDCHYTVYFSCKVDGETCTGEARAFRKYQSDDITWFHFEIFREKDGKSIVETYDDDYETIIEDYYKELKAKYA